MFRTMAIACGLLALAGPVLAQTAPTPQAPSAETLALAKKVAVHDDFLVMIRAAGADEQAKTVKSLGDLTPDQKAKAEGIAQAKLAAGMDRVADLLATVYAQSFTPQQLKDMDAFLETQAGAAYSNRLLTILPALKGLQHFDLHKDTVAATCAEIGKGCPAQPATPSGTK